MYVTNGHVMVHVGFSHVTNDHMMVHVQGCHVMVHADDDMYYRGMSCDGHVTCISHVTCITEESPCN